MTVLPFRLPREDGPEYITLGEALERSLVTVTEVSEGGSVPDLKVANRADVAVLMLDGEELAGAKQNRVLNTTILLGAGTETVIPVSCTEQGRWSYQSPEFAHSGNIMARKIRSRKSRSVSESLKGQLSYQSDQGEVWESISELHASAGTHSQTGAMKDAFEAREEDLRSYEQAFPLEEGQQGLIVFIGNQPAGLDFVSRSDAYRHLHRQLIRSYAMDALTSPNSPKMEKDPLPEARQLVNSLEKCSEDAFESVGTGRDLRFEGRHIVGSALSAEDSVVHAAFFSDDENGTKRSRNLSALSRRKSYRRRRESGQSSEEG